MQAAADAEADWETLMNTHEMENALASAVLSEDPRQAASTLSGARIRKDHWKGMSATEKKAIFDEQFRQARGLGAPAPHVSLCVYSVRYITGD
jgi:RIB43A